MRKKFAYRIQSGHKGHPRAVGQWHNVQEHVLIAERALGHYLPQGSEVHHVDENTLNNANRNLVICQDRAYHKLLHCRADVVRAGGNPNTERMCGTCATPKPFAAFNQCKANKTYGLNPTCRECQRVLFKKWYDARASKRAAKAA